MGLDTESMLAGYVTERTLAWDSQAGVAYLMAHNRPSFLIILHVNHSNPVPDPYVCNCILVYRLSSSAP